MISKIENFTPKQQELAAFAKLLSHPARIAILEFLAKENRCISEKMYAIASTGKHFPNWKN